MAGCRNVCGVAGTPAFSGYSLLRLLPLVLFHDLQAGGPDFAVLPALDLHVHGLAGEPDALADVRLQQLALAADVDLAGAVLHPQAVRVEPAEADPAAPGV